jgi:hypothetical protein
MEVAYLDPQAVPSRAAENYELSIDVESRPVTIALIANTFVDAGRFLGHVEQALMDRMPTVTVIRYMKPDTSPASRDMQLDIVSKCDAVISAYGH